MKLLCFCARQGSRQLADRHLPQARYAAEFFQQLARSMLADSRYARQRCSHAALSPSQSMKSDSEAMGFVPNLLNDVENRRVVIETNWVAFAPRHEQQFLFFRDARERLRRQAKRIQRFSSRVQLADAAINENEGRERTLFFNEPAITARDCFAHAGEIIA